MEDQNQQPEGSKDETATPCIYPEPGKEPFNLTDEELGEAWKRA